MKSQNVTDSNSRDDHRREMNVLIANQIRKHSITPIRQMEVNRTNMLSQINKTRSRAVSQTAHQPQKMDEFNDTIPTAMLHNQKESRAQYDEDKDSQIKTAINTVFIQLSTKNGDGGRRGRGARGGHTEGRPSDLRSHNLTVNARVNNGIQTNELTQRPEDESEGSLIRHELTKKLSGVHDRMEIAHEPVAKVVDEAASPVRSSSSVETIKQDNNIQLNK